MRRVLVILIMMSACKGKAQAPQPAVTPLPAQKAAQAHPTGPLSGIESEQYYGVYVAGQKAGWAHERIVRAADGGVAVSTQVKIKIKRLNAQMTLEMGERTEYAPLPDGRLRAFESTEVQLGGATVVRSGRREGKDFKITVRAAGKTDEQVVPASNEQVSHALAKLLINALKDSKTSTLEVVMFDKQQFKDRAVLVSLESQKRTRIQGVPVTVYTVKSLDKERAITTITRITGTGRMLETSVGAGIKLVLEERAVAMNPNVALLDLYTAATVPIDRPLGSPQQITRLKLAFEGLPPTLKLSDGRQILEGSTLTVSRRALRELPRVALSVEAKTAWLKSTALIDHDAPSIRDLARSVPVQKSSQEYVRRMADAVHKRLKYTLATAPPSASTILSGGKGDCTEYSLLMVAVARASGLPARVVSGMAYAGDSDPSFAFHAWAEVYIDGAWLAADPTWNQVPIDATHIAVSRDDPTPIVALLGGVKAAVKELVR